MKDKLNEWLNPIINRDLTDNEIEIYEHYITTDFYRLDFTYLNEDEKEVAINFFKNS